MIHDRRERRYSNISLPAGTLKTVAFDIMPRRSHCFMEENVGTLFSPPDVQRKGME
jgi:hypothetical protein